MDEAGADTHGREVLTLFAALVAAQAVQQAVVGQVQYAPEIVLCIHVPVQAQMQQSCSCCV